MSRRGVVSLGAAVLAALGSAAASGLLVPNAAAQVARSRDEDETPPALLVSPANAAPSVLVAHGSHSSHSSHSSHASHRSHYSSSGGGGGGGGGDDSAWGAVAPAVSQPPPPPPPPPPPKPARVAFAAYPGGSILLDGKAVGRDVTEALVLKPGSYEIRVENRFLGNHSIRIDVAEGQTGTINIDW